MSVADFPNPGIPSIVTPLVYSTPPPHVPFLVSENLKGCPLLETCS